MRDTFNVIRVVVCGTALLAFASSALASSWPSWPFPPILMPPVIGSPDPVLPVGGAEPGTVEDPPPPVIVRPPIGGIVIGPPVVNLPPVVFPDPPVQPEPPVIIVDPIPLSENEWYVLHFNSAMDGVVADFEARLAEINAQVGAAMASGMSDQSLGALVKQGKTELKVAFKAAQALIKSNATQAKAVLKSHDAERSLQREVADHAKACKAELKTLNAEGMNNIGRF